VRWLDRALLLPTAVAVLVSLLPLGARFSWLLELTTHFRLQYLAVTAALLGALALRRRWRPCAWLAVAGLVSAWPVAPYLPLAATTPLQSGFAPLRLITVNVSFLQFSAKRFHEIVRTADADIVVVQEFTPHAAEVLAELDNVYPHSLKFPADGPYGIALWSRFEFESAVPFALARRPALEARIRGPSGVFTIIGVHLDAPTSMRRAAARNEELKQLALRSAATEGPLVVAGDFNTTPYSPYFADWLAASGLTDSRRGRTLSISWPSMLPMFGIPIDHVAVSHDFRILAHRRLPSFDSDHFGVVVDIAVPRPAGGSP